MFYGTERAPESWFRLAAERGFTDLVGMTHNDVSRFGQTVPRGALEAALWLESDRMGHLAAALTQQKLDAQRAVVEQEILQGHNQPYGDILERIMAATYPAGHPYHREAVGTSAELRTVTLEEVRAWLRQYYTPNNAVLILAGDVDLATARAVVPRYFAAIPPGPPLERPLRRPAPMAADRHDRVEARVPHPRLYRVWNIAGLGTAEYDDLRLLADILGSGPGSRLNARLVQGTGLATEAAAWIHPKELGSSLIVQVSLAPGGDSLLPRADSVVRAEVARLLADGPTPSEITRAAAGPRNWFLGITEQVGGYGGRADQIGWSYLFGGRPDYFAVQMRRWLRATPDELVRTGRAWLAHGSYRLDVLLAPALSAGPTADRARIPAMGAAAAPAFPALQHATLSNGLQVVLAPRRGATMVSATVVVQGGLAAEGAHNAGTGLFLFGMMIRASAGRGAVETADLASRLGASFTVQTRADGYLAGVSAPRANFAASLGLLADGVVRPALTPPEVEERRRQMLSELSAETSSPRTRARRVVTSRLYHSDHPYAQPWSGTGSRAPVAAVTADSLARFHLRWVRPGNATLVVSGDLSMDQLVAAAGAAFGSWEAGPTPQIALPEPTPPMAPRIYLVDDPGAAQSEIALGFLVPPTADSSEVSLEVLGRLFAVGSNSRLGRNLREEKNWSYGTGLFRPDARGARPFVVFAAVQADRTADAMLEIIREMDFAVRPVREDELAEVRSYLVLGAPGRMQTTRSVAEAAVRATLFRLPGAYFSGYPDAVARIRREALPAAAARVFSGPPVWVVVGDRARIEGPLRQAGIGEVQIITDR
jgi:zinc protease